MAGPSRDALLLAAFVKMADTLVDDYDVVDLMDTLVQECSVLVDSDAGGLLIADSRGVLQLIASTSEEAEFVEINQLTAGEGPCVESFLTGRSVTIGDIDAVHDKWPVFRDAALGQGFHSMHAFPMKLRGRTIGAMNLFSVTPGSLSESDVAVAQALADVATIGILQERALRDAAILTSQLQHALDSRVTIEQAKGVIAARTGLSMHDAFGVLRDHARVHRMKLGTVARGVVDLTLVVPVSATE